MKTTVIAAAIVLLTATTANATPMVVIDSFSTNPPIASRSLFANNDLPANTVTIDNVEHTATIHRDTDIGELGILYSFPTSVFVGALTTQTYLQIPIISAPATNSFLQVNASYEGGNSLGPQQWGGTRAFVFNPNSGDVVSADLTFALNVIDNPEDFFHSGFTKFRIFIPNHPTMVGDLVFGPPVIVGVPEPTTCGLALVAAMLCAIRRSRPSPDPLERE